MAKIEYENGESWQCKWRVGMLRGVGDSFTWKSVLVSWFLCSSFVGVFLSGSLIYWCLVYGCLVFCWRRAFLILAWFLDFLVSWFQSVVVRRLLVLAFLFVCCLVFCFLGFLIYWLLVSWFLAFCVYRCQRFLVYCFLYFWISWFLGCLVSCFLGSWYQSFLVFRFRSLLASNCFSFYVTKIYQMFISRFLEDPDPMSKISKNLLDWSTGLFDARLFPNKIRFLEFIFWFSNIYSSNMLRESS